MKWFLLLSYHLFTVLDGVSQHLYLRNQRVEVELPMIHAQGKTRQNWEICKILF